MIINGKIVARPKIIDGTDAPNNMAEKNFQLEKNLSNFGIFFFPDLVKSVVYYIYLYASIMPYLNIQ